MRKRLLLAGPTIALAMAAWLAPPPVAAQGVGTVQLVNVWAYGTPPGTSRQDRFVRDVVVAREVVETVPSGSMHVVFLDDTVLRLGPGSLATLDRFAYDPATDAGELSADLGKGAFRFISGRLNRAGVQLRTPTSVIGIRGTDFLVSVAATGATLITVISGIVEVTPIGGGPSVSVAAGQAVSVASATAAPASAAPDVMDPSLSDPGAPSDSGSDGGTGDGGGGDGSSPSPGFD